VKRFFHIVVHLQEGVNFRIGPHGSLARVLAVVESSTKGAKLLMMQLAKIVLCKVTILGNATKLPVVRKRCKLLLLLVLMSLFSYSSGLQNV
jgi:hypothetical protein